MTDNMEEEHIDNQTNFQLDSSSDKIIATNLQETINPNQETENMEVHHHPDLQHKPKKWKEYFLEFLMIFLAVTLGFFAENIREHQVDKDREMQYIISLVQDLKGDIAAFNENANFWDNRLNGIDSMMFYIKPPLIRENTERAYYWSIETFNFTDFKYHDGTIQQLRNAGNFRLIQKRNVIDSLVAYDGMIRNSYLNVEISTRSQYLLLRHMQAGLFNSFYLKNDSREFENSLNSEIKRNLIIQDKPDDIFKYYNELYNYKRLGSVLVYVDHSLQEMSVRLCKLIQQEYGLAL
jgi:hypothetical protein